MVETTGLFCPPNIFSNDDKKLPDLEIIKERVPNGFNIVLVVIKKGRLTVEEEHSYKDIIQSLSDEISSIFALVITGCENMSPEARSDCIADFTKAYPEIAQFMQKGIHTVGFPNITRMQPAFVEAYSEGMKSDREYLRRLVYSSDKMKQLPIHDLVPQMFKKLNFDATCSIT